MVLTAAVRYRSSILHRTIWLQLLFSLPAFNFLCEACKKVTFHVPHKLDAGMFVGRVNMKRCFKHSGIISSSNPNFTILEDGSLYTTNDISLSSHENNITIFFKDIHEQKKIYVSLLTYPEKTQRTKARHVRDTALRRTKRRWVPVPTIIMENSLGPFPMQIQQLTSDMALKYNIRYSISGHGADKPPLNYFYIENETGNLFVTSPIDREVYPEFQLICYAATLDGYIPEIPLVHKIKIEDDNDNAPIFDRDVYTFHILENSRIGTLVGQVIAIDEDEPHTLHTKVKYKFVSHNRQSYQNSQAFVVHPDTGSITVASSELDRETISEYKLTMEARDMGGQEFGLCSIAEVVIEICDVNDNAPQLVQTVYEVHLSENTIKGEILCIPVIDDDEPGTTSWLATFTIIKGNEDNSFSITVDQETNVGCLAALKGLDYENTKERRLEIVVNNEAPYAPYSRPLLTSMITVVIRIRDQDEGPVFEPSEYILNIKECLPGGTVVGSYQARDPETGNSGGLSYRIINDPCSWITIDHMGQLRTTKILDRDVPNMKHARCNVTICATDQSGKTGTGEIVIKLMDENDNYPVVTRQKYVMCMDKKPICITAFDADLPPYTIPFHFEIEKPMDLMWRITPSEDESALLSLVEDIDYGSYEIHVKISDNVGHSGTSEITVQYCNCVVPSDCFEPSADIPMDPIPLDIPEDQRPYEEMSNSDFGPWGILATVLGSLLLLLGLGIPLGFWLHSKVPMAQEVCDNLAFQNLIKSNTEAPGEELTDLPVKTMNASMSMSTTGEKTGRQEGLEVVNEEHHTAELMNGGGNHVAGSLLDFEQPLRYSYRDFCSEWQNFTNPHLTEMVFLCGQDEEHKHAGEYVLSFKYEGKESPVGSLSSCTGQSDEEELDFLNHPEPPFRTLVEAFAKE
ncbi:desmocollin-2-like [Elgaria multicarinata webbii]|uniref:desmocollin-2-like n=1 Tax=Elgaria multicarinata webbii TaxID=159646 RepID=UPI002FCCF575